MKKLLILTVVLLTIMAVYWLMPGTGTISKEKVSAINKYLKTVIVETTEKNYQRHNIFISVLVTNITTAKITKKETPEYISYTAYGKVSYIIKGKRTWPDKEGNLIHLDPEKEITHWFSCDIREDKYGELYTDKYRIPLTLYADNPLP